MKNITPSIDWSRTVKRLFDLILGVSLALLLVVPIAVIAALVRLMSPGPAIHWSDRVGRSNVIFRMPKFRTMKIDTPNVATDLLDYPERYITPLGRFLRLTSFDELPQIWSILKGDMSFVGPRPALFNQYDLIALRTKTGLHELIPGLTGWAQVNGRDILTDQDKVRYDNEYRQRQSMLFDLYILWRTVIIVASRDGILH